MYVMAKRITTAKKLDRLIHVGKATPRKPAPRKAIVEATGQILARPENKKYIKHIAYISIVRCVDKVGFRITGRVTTKPDGRKYYKIIDDGEHSIEFYKSCVVHELAHIQWPVLHKYHNEAFSKFVKIADSLSAVNDYGKRRENMWRIYTTKGMPHGISHWANEMHSAAAELVYYPNGRHDWLGTSENRNKLIEAYKELHGI